MKYALIPILPAVAVLLITNPSFKSEAQTGSADVRVGFVNLKRVFEKYKLSQEMEKKIEKYQGECQEHIDRLKKEKSELASKLQSLPPDHNEYTEVQSALEELNKRIINEESNLKKNIVRQLKDATKAIYKDILKCCEECREDNGLMMLMTVVPGEIEGDTHVELTYKINSRQVIAWDSKMEYTDEVIRRLNTK